MTLDIAMHPKQTTLSVDIAGGSSFTEVINVVKIRPPSKKRRQAKTTILKATNDWATKIAGWKEGDNLTFTILLTQSNYETLDTAFEADTQCNWKIQFPKVTGQVTNGDTFTFLGNITMLHITEGGTDSDDVFMVEVEVEISGKPVYASGA